MASRNTTGETYGKGRTRNYATMIYPESAPDNWYEILSDLHIQALISPLHDKDLNPGGEYKKPHYHVLIMFDTVKTREQAIDVFNRIGGVGCEVVQTQRGYARYLCHLDNPEKAQYSVDDVISLCGADYNAIISLVTDKYKAIREMIQFCCENGLDSFSKLLEYSSVERPDWFRVLCDSGAVVMREYLKSKSWTDSRNS